MAFFLRILKRTVQYIGNKVGNLQSPLDKLAMVMAWSCNANFGLLSLFIFSEFRLF